MEIAVSEANVAAGHCHHCSLQTYGEDAQELADIADIDGDAEVECVGCGTIFVDSHGECLTHDHERGHASDCACLDDGRCAARVYYTTMGHLVLPATRRELDEAARARRPDPAPSATAPAGATRNTQQGDRVSETTQTTAKNVDIVREGTQIVLPPGMTYAEGREWLTRQEKEEETEVAIYHEIACFPLDGAVAFHKALAHIYGWTGLIPTPGFWGPSPPTMVNVPTGVNESVDVPWGRVTIPNVAGYLQTNMQMEPRPKFVIGGKTKKKHMPEVNAIAVKTREFLARDSIYKGKAIKVSWEWQRRGDDFNPNEHCPKFMNLGLFDPEELVLSRDVQSKVDLGLFTPIEHTQHCRDNLIPLKRGVLLHGEYGTGKTLTAYATASRATRHGWTFLYLQSVLDLQAGIELAALYQPAVLFAEDIDKVISGEDRTEAMNQILNTLDGIDSKSMEVIVVVTSNHAERLNRAIVRPGRLDTVVHVTSPDADAAQRLVRLYGRGLISDGADMKVIGEALQGQIPAFIREVVERAKLAAVRRRARSGFGGDIKGHVLEDDILAAVAQMSDHAAMLAPPDERPEREHEVFIPVPFAKAGEFISHVATLAEFVKRGPARRR